MKIKLEVLITKSVEIEQTVNIEIDDYSSEEEANRIALEECDSFDWEEISQGNIEFNFVDADNGDEWEGQ